MNSEELQTFNSTLADILTKRSREVIGICDQDCKSFFVVRQTYFALRPRHDRDEDKGRTGTRRGGSTVITRFLYLP